MFCSQMKRILLSSLLIAGSLSHVFGVCEWKPDTEGPGCRIPICECENEENEPCLEENKPTVFPDNVPVCEHQPRYDGQDILYSKYKFKSNACGIVQGEYDIDEYDPSKLTCHLLGDSLDKLDNTECDYFQINKCDESRYSLPEDFTCIPPEGSSLTCILSSGEPDQEVELKLVFETYESFTFNEGRPDSQLKDDGDEGDEGGSFVKATRSACLGLFDKKCSFYGFDSEESSALKVCSELPILSCEISELEYKCYNRLDGRLPDCTEDHPNPIQCISGCEVTDFVPLDGNPFKLQCEEKKCQLLVKDQDSDTTTPYNVSYEGEVTTENPLDSKIYLSTPEICQEYLEQKCNFSLCETADGTSGEKEYVECTCSGFKSDECDISPSVCFNPVLEKEVEEEKCDSSSVTCPCASSLLNKFAYIPVEPAPEPATECTTDALKLLFTYNGVEFKVDDKCEEDDADCVLIKAEAESRLEAFDETKKTLLSLTNVEGDRPLCAGFYLPHQDYTDNCCFQDGCIAKVDDEKNAPCYIVDPEATSDVRAEVTSGLCDPLYPLFEENFSKKTGCQLSSCETTCRSEDGVLSTDSVECFAPSKRNVDLSFCTEFSDSFLTTCREKDVFVPLCEVDSIDYVWIVKEDATFTCSGCVEGHKTYLPTDYQCRVKIEEEFTVPFYKDESCKDVTPSTEPEPCNYEDQCTTLQKCTEVDSKPTCICENNKTGDLCDTCPEKCFNNGTYENEQCEICTCGAYLTGSRCECSTGVFTLLFDAPSNITPEFLQKLEDDVEKELSQVINVLGVTFTVKARETTEKRYLNIVITLQACDGTVETAQLRRNISSSPIFAALKTLFAVSSAAADLKAAYDQLSEALITTLSTTPAFEKYRADTGFSYGGICDEADEECPPKCFLKCGEIPAGVDDNTGTIIGIIIGVVFIALLGVTIYCCFCAGEKSEVKYGNNGMNLDDTSAYIGTGAQKSNTIQMASSAPSSGAPKSAMGSASVRTTDATMNGNSTHHEIDERPLPLNWIECTTDDGNVYYWNEITEESCWERPTA